MIVSPTEEKEVFLLSYFENTIVIFFLNKRESFL